MYSSDSGNKNLIIEHIVEIANALDGKTEATTTAPKTESRIRDALGRIADYFEANPGGSSALPSVSASDNGKVLKVVNGAWAVASVEDPDDTQPGG